MVSCRVGSLRDRKWPEPSGVGEDLGRRDLPSHDGGDWSSRWQSPGDCGRAPAAHAASPGGLVCCARLPFPSPSSATRLPGSARAQPRTPRRAAARPGGCVFRFEGSGARPGSGLACTRSRLIHGAPTPHTPPAEPRSRTAARDLGSDPQLCAPRR